MPCFQIPSVSASAGVGCPSIEHWSMKCSWEPERLFNSEVDHLWLNPRGVLLSAGSRGPCGRTLEQAGGIRQGRLRAAVHGVEVCSGRREGGVDPVRKHTMATPNSAALRRGRALRLLGPKWGSIAGKALPEQDSMELGTLWVNTRGVTRLEGIQHSWSCVPPVFSGSLHCRPSPSASQAATRSPPVTSLLPFILHSY